MSSSYGVLKNLSWKFAERISAQLVTMIVSIVLGRLLEPSHYGIISIVTIFITIANVFVSDGLGSALIQKHNADALDFSSVLWVNIALSIVLYGVLYFIAPYISLFYGEGYEILTPVLRVLGIRIIFSAINSVQQAYVSRKMIFQKFFLATLLGTVLSAIVGISMAYHGFGVWALVGQYMTNTTVDTVVLGISLGKVPLFKISIHRLKGLFRYGLNILGTGLLIVGYQELRSLIIGKMYTSSDLAFYERGRQFPNLAVTNINVSIGAVLFPKMASEQKNVHKVKDITRKSILYSSFIMCPIMFGLAAVSESFITILLTEKWLPCVVFLRLFCVIYLFYPIHTANMQAIKAMGRSDVLLKLEFIKKAIELITILITMWISVEAIVIGLALITTAFTFLNAYPNVKLLNYTIKEQLCDILPSMCNALIMFLVVFAIDFVTMNIVIKLVLQILTGVIVYIGIAVVTKRSELQYIKKMILNVFHK